MWIYFIYLFMLINNYIDLSPSPKSMLFNAREH